LASPVPRDHTRLRVFDTADRLTVTVYDLTRRLPDIERFGLQSQIRRAAVSVATNIVEGCARHSDPDYARFLETALGSACEARYLLELCTRLKMLESSACRRTIDDYSHVIRGLVVLLTKIRLDIEAKRRQLGVRRTSSQLTADR
jgi:four helix bundle protein